MKKHTLITLLLAGCMAFAPTAVYAEAEDAAAEETGELSDDLYSYQLSIDGVVYQLPMTLDTLTDQGWTMGKNTDPDEMLRSNSYTSVRYNKGENTISVDVLNFDINEKPIGECLAGGFDIDANYDFNAETTAVILPKGIEVGKATLDDIKAAYGEPSDTYEGDLYTKVSYEQDIYEEVELYVYNEEGTLQQLSMRYYVEPEDFERGEVSTDIPEIVSAYQAPAEQGDGFLSPVVEYFGDLYQLPAPVSAFTANGWVIKDAAEGDYVAGRDIDFIDMMKDNQTVHFSVYNETQNATAVENCFVEELEFGTYDPEVLALKLSGDITLGAKKEDLLAIAEEKGYLYEEDDDRIRFYPNKDDQYDNYVNFWFNTDESDTDVASITYRNQILPD